uniref:Mismatch repair endonuclease PMS2 n=1 Tax=Anthurium amnicola TaxID=1678845 RepID=A0A1D1YJX7_9ARAE
MAGSSDCPTIKAIAKGVIHRVCSGQVILDLSAAVKELVENSLDAGATSIEISLKEYGEECIKVTDNGCGISPNNFQAYALIAKGVRFVCTNTTAKNQKSVVLKTQGSGSLKDNIINIFGLDTFTCLEPLSLSVSEGCNVEGFLSKPRQGSGRNLGDRQFFFVNGRPVDMPKVSKLVNELYKCSNSKKYPIVVMNIIIATKSYDVNVTPDKRKIFFSDEGSLMLSLREAIEKIYSPSHCSYSINEIEEPDRETYANESDASDGDNDLLTSTRPVTFNGSEQLKDADRQELLSDDISPKTTEIRQGSCVGEINSWNGDDSFIQKDCTHSVQDKDNGILTTDQCAQPRNFPYQQLQTSAFASSPRRPVKCDVAQNVNPSSGSKIVQTSLAKFMTVSKRKHESSCHILSELPLLRNKMASSQVGVTGSETVSLEANSCDLPNDNSPEVKRNKLLEISEPCNVLKRVEVHSVSICEIGTREEKSESGDLALCPADADTQASHSEDLKNSPTDTTLANEAINALKPCSATGSCSFLQFNIKEIRARRNQSLRFHFDVVSNESKGTGRYYTAATLRNSHSEDEDGKAESLIAATIELEKYFKKQDFRKMKVIGQFNLGFIIGKLDQDLFIVDQHAADEKYNFERLAKSTILNQQPLLKPLRLELSPEEEVVASMNMEIIRKNGFSLTEDVHASPGHHFLLKSVPFSKNMTFGVEDVKELISIISDGQGECCVMSSYKMDTRDSLCPSRVRAMLASRACRYSIMIGDPLAKNEMQKILENLAGLRSPWNCPHGRPTMRHLVDLTTVRNM